jgi:hypothetical protein
MSGRVGNANTHMDGEIAPSSHTASAKRKGKGKDVKIFIYYYMDNKNPVVKHLLEL